MFQSNLQLPQARGLAVVQGAMRTWSAGDSETERPEEACPRGFQKLQPRQLWSFLTPSALVLAVPVTFIGNVLLCLESSLEANGLFFCVLKICRTPRCLLEADKQVETRRGLYSPIIPCFPKPCIEQPQGHFVQIRSQTPFLPLH